MNLQLAHDIDDGVSLHCGDIELFRYTYVSHVPQRESPKPFFHPMRTLQGDVITGFRPTDHLWHTGLSMTSAHLSGENFWGGPTFLRGQSYQELKNTGTQKHIAWDTMQRTQRGAELAHRLEWHTFGGEHWLDEQRRHVITVEPEENYWMIDTSMQLTNVSGGTLSFGSPTTEGRPNAGYGSLFWRGPRDFTDGSVLDAEGRTDAEEVRGNPSPWLAYYSRHDGTFHETTLIFIDRPSNPRYPNKWFVRASPTPVLSYSFMFDEEYELPAGETLSLDYRMVIASGTWDQKQIEPFAK